MSIWEAVGREHELKKALEVARRLVAAGVDPKVIAEVTDLPREKVAALRKAS